MLARLAFSLNLAFSPGRRDKGVNVGLVWARKRRLFSRRFAFVDQVEEVRLVGYFLPFLPLGLSSSPGAVDGSGLAGFPPPLPPPVPPPSSRLTVNLSNLFTPTPREKIPTLVAAGSTT